jgi:hypothetical protein
VFILGLCCVPSVRSAEARRPDLDAEARQVAEEEAQEAKDRLQGKKPQSTFMGIIQMRSDPDPDNPEVIGAFLTDKSDVVPDQVYLLKVDKNNKLIIDAITKLNGKKAVLQGRLRNERKYLIVTNIVEMGATQPPKERFKRGGL